MEFDLLALIAAIGFLSIGFIALIIAKRLSIELGASGWTLFFAPVLIYLVFGGFLSEFKAPGFEAKFREFTNQPVPVGLLEATELVGLDAPETDIQATTLFAVGQSVIAINASEWDKFSETQKEDQSVATAVAIYQSILAGGFEGLIVLDGDNNPIGFIETSYFYELLRIPLDRNILSSDEQVFVLNKQQRLARLKETRTWTLLKNPEFRGKRDGSKPWIKFSASQADAYKQMINNGYNELVVLDEKGKYKGVLTKERLTDAILSELISLNINSE